MTSSDDPWARTQSPTGSQRRKLSFQPTGEWFPPAIHDEEPLGAEPVSKPKRIAQVACAVVYCLLAAGTVFGFAALKPVLVEEGVYRETCTPDELEEGVYTCYEQELRLNLMFTVAAVSTNVCALPVGTVLDRYGPKVASVVGVVNLTIGALAMAFADYLPFDAYVVSYLFLALGGPFVFISSFQLSNTFPQHSGLILALLTGAFDTSSAVFLFYRLIYQATDGAFKPRHFFLLYLVVPVFILTAQLFLMPNQSYKTASEQMKQGEEFTNNVRGSDNEFGGDGHQAPTQQQRRAHRKSGASETTALLDNTKNDRTNENENTPNTTAPHPVWGALHGRTALQQITTPWFLLITLFTMLQMLRINYFVATLRTQYTHLLHSAELATHVNEVFDIALPLGGIVAVPFIGLILDKTSTPFVLGLLVTIATAIGVLGIVEDSLPAAYANVALFVVYRPFYYTAVSDYAAKVFGFVTFGKVYGLIICLAGLFNFAQAGLDALTHGVFANNPVPVNLILLVAAAAVGVALVGYVWRKSYTMQREKLEEEAEEAREVRIPDSGVGRAGGSGR
ncbi:MFS general substrate transporter [Hortaea werneckii]|nr:MFS general substrate transporter [Hortaea werneckii]KAI7321260.1 MFS general substrate transporter [Hortaea werneckii]